MTKAIVPSFLTVIQSLFPHQNIMDIEEAAFWASSNDCIFVSSLSLRCLRTLPKIHCYRVFLQILKNNVNQVHTKRSKGLKCVDFHWHLAVVCYHLSLNLLLESRLPFELRMVEYWWNLGVWNNLTPNAMMFLSQTTIVTGESRLEWRKRKTSVPVTIQMFRLYFSFQAGFQQQKPGLRLFEWKLRFG